MIKKLLIFSLTLAAGVVAVPHLQALDPKVMPEQYACVATPGDYYQHWEQVVLWGKTTNNRYIDKGYSYSWDYGDGSQAQAWAGIVSYWSASPYTSSSEYLCSDSHTYPTATTDIKYYTATLRIRNDLNPSTIVSSATLVVTTVNFYKIDAAHGYSSKDIEVVKRQFLESIVRGRGLMRLYLTQDRSGGASDGSWPGYIPYSIHGRSHTAYLPFFGTATALKSFLYNSHTISDPTGAIDPFYDCVIKGFNYFFRNALISSAVNNPSTGDSDLNGNGFKIEIAGPTFSVPGSYLDFTEALQHGLAMQALGYFYAQDPGFTVNVGPSGTPMLLRDVVIDTVDYAASAQNNYGWYSGYRDGNDIDISGHVVSGLTAIEQNWKIKAPAYVRDRLLHFVRAVQNNLGGAWRQSTGTETSLFTNPPPAGTGGGIEGTCGLLQAMYYLSLDKTVTSACQCDLTNTDSHCNTPANDFKLIYNAKTHDYSGSCNRVMGAINWLGRVQLYWLMDPFTYLRPIYQYELISDVLQKYNYVRGGVNDGVLVEDPNYPWGTPDASIYSLPAISLGAAGNGCLLQWEDTYSANITSNFMSGSGTVGYWNWGDYTYVGWGSDIGASWAIISISRPPNNSIPLKTENSLPRILREACNSKGLQVRF